MDFFKIFTLIFMIILFYKVFLMDNTEGFESTTPSLIDDWNAVNQLAQISKKLMAGGLTIPGTLTTPNLVATNISLNGTDLQKTLNTFNDSINQKFSQFETKLNTAITDAKTQITNGLSTAIKQDDSVRLYHKNCDWAPGNGTNGNALGMGSSFINVTLPGFGSTWKISKS